MAASSVARWLIRALAVLSGFGALGCAALFVQAVRLPYNEQGRYFEEGVVHDAQGLGVYGGLACFLALLAVLFAWLARRLK